MARMVRVCVRVPAEWLEEAREYAERLKRATGADVALSEVIRAAINYGLPHVRWDVEELESIETIREIARRWSGRDTRGDNREA